MKNNFKIALLQLSPKKGDCNKNTQTIIKYMKLAANENSDILLLPECFITGYNILPLKNEDALDDNNVYLKEICAAAESLKLGVVATSFTKGSLNPRNSAFVIDKKGKILMKYDKVHTCDFSLEKCLEGGEEFKVCDFHGVKIGIMICYDREYPESARILMLKGAEIILVPNDCGSMKPRLNALSTRAFENMCVVAMANPPGKNKGNSCVFSPVCWDKKGRIVDNTIFMANETDKNLFFAEVNLSSLRKYRKNEMLGNTFRKVNAYSDLLSEEIHKPFIRKK